LDLKATQILVLIHSQELVQETKKVAIALGNDIGASRHACTGSANICAEVQKLQMEALLSLWVPLTACLICLTGDTCLPNTKMYALNEDDEIISCRFKDQINTYSKSSKATSM
jgi:hypothetical protein